MPESATIAYLTSVYARASDSFIRGEVAQLRALGFTVHTFSIRRPEARELVSEEIRREHAATEFVLEAGVARLALAWLRTVLRSPRRALAAARLAVRIGTPGLKGRLWPLAYLLEAAYLAERLRAKGVEHLHNHIGEGSASVAMLASVLSGIPFSMTIHGPSEFDRPTLLALDEKIRRAAFTVAVSEFGRSQLYRWSDPADWPKIHVVHCGLDGTFLDAGATAIPEARRLVCVGRLAEQKGPLLLVEAARRLAAEGLAFELVLVGDGPLRRPIEGLVERLGLREHVRLAGWQGSRGGARGDPPGAGPGAAELRRGPAGGPDGGAGPGTAGHQHLRGGHPRAGRARGLRLARPRGIGRGTDRGDARSPVGLGPTTWSASARPVPPARPFSTTVPSRPPSWPP